MKLKLPAEIYSAADLRAVTIELRSYSQWFARMAVKQRVASNKAVGEVPELSTGAVSLLRSATEKDLTQAVLDDILEELARLASVAPQLSITLAAPATGELRRQLVAWCRDNLAPDALVSFSFNRLLLGGMVVRGGSHIYDWSFRRQIMDKRDTFPEVLRRV